METSTAVALALVLSIALWVPYFIFYIAEERRADTPGSHGGGRGVTPTLVRTLDSARLARGQTKRGAPAID